MVWVYSDDQNYLEPLKLDEQNCHRYYPHSIALALCYASAMLYYAIAMLCYASVIAYCLKAVGDLL